LSILKKTRLAGCVLAVLTAAALLAACGGGAETPTAEQETAPAETEETEAPTEAAQQEPTAEEATEEPAEEPAEEAEAAGEAVPIEAMEEVPVFTTASNVVGTGFYAAAEAYAIPAGEDAEAEPLQAFIMPYAIYPNMHVESLEDFDPAAQDYRIEVEGFEFEWSLETPEDSEAELLTGDGVARWQTDLPGDYVLTLTATDEAGNTATTTWTVHAASYVGVGTMTGDAPTTPECGTCHASKVENWAATGHATIFTRAIDGEASDHYAPECIVCHTTGFNNRPEADDGGFDDVARASGWEFPAVMEEGNWDQMVAEHPEAAAMANVQCESCHGPGSDHFTGDVENIGPISTGLEYGACAQCHAEDPYHVVPQQWENSAHADRTARAFWYPTGEDRADCVGCHTGGGYIDAANGVPVDERRTDYQPITCAVCHDPHDADSPNQLRVFNLVILPDGTQLTDKGTAATCMTCHNTRVDPVEAVEGDEFHTPHYSAAAELVNGTGGYTWGQELPNMLHVTILEDSCITCHMAETPGMTEDGEPLPGHNEIGGHTLAMTSEDGVENVAVCQQCHGEEMQQFELQATEDYDGDDVLETNEEEIQGLLALVRSEIELRGVEILDQHPYFELPEDANTDLKGAVYNYKLVLDNPQPAHNLDYIVALLQLSYEKLTGQPVSGAELLY
jgi:hypothetical protein